MKLFNSRKEVIQYIEKRRIEGAKVIDFGSRGNSWTKDFVDAIVDLEPKSEKGKKSYVADFNYPSSFKDIDKYEISITSHTLEDLRTLNFLLDTLSLLSNEGFIIVPSSYIEFSYLESFNYLGCYHHRWIFTFNGEELIIYPKLANLNCFFGTTTFARRVFSVSPKIKIFLKIHYPLIYIFNFLFKKRFKNHNKTNKRKELIIHWEKKLNYKFVNNDYMSSGQTIIDWYKNILINDKNMKIKYE